MWFRCLSLVFIKVSQPRGGGGGGVEREEGASPADPALLLHCQILFFQT